MTERPRDYEWSKKEYIDELERELVSRLGTRHRETVVDIMRIFHQWLQAHMNLGDAINAALLDNLRERVGGIPHRRKGNDDPE